MDQVPNSNNGEIDQICFTHKRVLRLEQYYYLAESRKQVICEDLVKCFADCSYKFGKWTKTSNTNGEEEQLVHWIAQR